MTLPTPAGCDPQRRKQISVGPFKHVAAFILAGGASARLGRDKALVEFDGVPLIVRAARLLDSLTGVSTVIGPPVRFAGLRLRVVPDDEPGLGPLGGIATALRVSKEPWNLVIGCDLPYLTPDWLAYLIGRASGSRVDVLWPQSERGPEPLCAMYHSRCEGAVATALARGVRKVTDGFAGLQIEMITCSEWKAFDPEGLLFKNMNLPEDYEEAQSRLRREGTS